MISFSRLQLGTKMSISGREKDGGMTLVSHVWFVKKYFISICLK